MSMQRSTRRRSRESIERMEVCPRCRSELVQPVEWWERDGYTWGVELRCPECELRRRGAFNQMQVDSYDRNLDDGGRALASDLLAVTRENMEHEAESFGMALRSGAILPEDF